MAEIYCRTATKPEDKPSGSTRAARRRRMEIRRFRLISEVDGLAAPTEGEDEANDDGRKKRRIDEGLSEILWPGSADAAVPREDGSGDEDDSDLGRRYASEVPKGCAAKLASEDRCPRFGMTSVCGRRRDMEDAVAVRPDFARGCHVTAGGHHFFGVYDGHGCSHVAASCRDRMHELVAEEMSKDGSGPLPSADDGWWKSVMERSFTRMDAEVVISDVGDPRPNPNCRCEFQVPKCNHVGSTAVVAVVGSDRIVVANCGDSRAVLCRRKGAPLPLSNDHKPDRPDELQRIEDAGGRVIYWDGARVLGVLAMSRAIGDGYLKPYVTSEPEVTVTERSDDDECLILASDGLWDVVTNETACEVVRMCLQGGGTSSGTVVSDEPEYNAADESQGKAYFDAAILLTKLALARQSADNVSVIIIDLRRRRCR